jgi:hypothetical protein
MRITRRPSYRPLFNIAPTDQHIIITAEFERRKAHRTLGFGQPLGGTIAAPANASTPGSKRSNSGHPAKSLERAKTG